MTGLRARLRRIADRHDLVSVIACAFDHSTRMLPFFWADVKMAPAGARAIGAAMADCGFGKTRIVLQQWNKNFQPSKMRLDGRVPDLFMVSSMLLHTAQCQAMIRDACRIDLAVRPLIIAGGPLVIYEPWNVFSPDPEDPWGADVAVTGEEYVLLSMLEVLLSLRAGKEPMRSVFQRARDSGELDGIPGLVYGKPDARGMARELVDTGIQRLLGDLDELPDPVEGYRLLEPPSSLSTLASKAIPADQVRKHTRVASIVLTQGCRFSCPYCAIPAYNQRQFRAKSGEKVADEIERIYNQFDIRAFFGADDNFFADKHRAMSIAETLASRVDAGSRPHCKIRWATEATIHSTLQMSDELSSVRKAGLVALWLGVEDVSGKLVNKGQSGEHTLEAFSILRQNGIYPVPMLMHYDAQPLFSWSTNRGLLNQLHLLRKAGALYMQVMMLGPAPGSKWYAESFTSGLAFERVGGIKVTPAVLDGMHVVASRHPHPWIKQMNLLAAYVFFFNPVRLLWALFFSKSRIPLADEPNWPPAAIARELPKRKQFTRRIEGKLKAHLIDAGHQLFGIIGLFPTVRRLWGWTLKLAFGRIERHTNAPTSTIPMRNVEGGKASHALPGTPDTICAPPTDRADQSTSPTIFVTTSRKISKIY
jgi:radical SAM superfamily enzyme YgiQ (UPF0313 family)